MCDQNAVLRVLAPLGALAEPCSATLIADRLRGAPHRRVIACLGRLMQRKLVARANKRTGFADRSEPLYVATKAGADCVRSGKLITSGPKGALAGVRRRDGTFRQRVWNAFRILKKATLPQLIEIARESGDGDGIESNTLKYMNALVRAGVAARLPTRERGFALTSPGHVRFALIRDLGPLAPQAARKHLVNLNDGNDARFISYGEAA
jgi:hypothetical protein